jgi:hypothetical protein
MKKVLLFAGVLFLFSATSCKKDYTCSCTALGSTEDYKYEKVSKKDAEDACDASSATYALLGGSCELK